MILSIRLILEPVAYCFLLLDEKVLVGIAETMACGCPSHNNRCSANDRSGGKAGFFIPCRPMNKELVNDWALDSTKQISNIMELSDEERQSSLNIGLTKLKNLIR
jgi:hypothetical protein